MVQHDFAGESATVAVVEAIAAVLGTEPIELPPLYDAIDTDALDALYESHDGEGELRVEFCYNGFNIVVQGGPQVTVCLEEKPE